MMPDNELVDRLRSLHLNGIGYMWNGFKVYPSALIPPARQRVELSPEAGCSDDVLKSFNSWLLERFGKTPDIFLHEPTGSLMVSMQAYTALRMVRDANHEVFKYTI